MLLRKLICEGRKYTDIRKTLRWSHHFITRGLFGP